MTKQTEATDFWGGCSAEFTNLFDRPTADTRPADARAMANGPWEGAPAVAPGDIIGCALSVLNQQLADSRAHVMSHPGAFLESAPRPALDASQLLPATLLDERRERQHVSDAAAPAFIEDLSAWETRADAEMVARRIGVVVLTVAEHDELLALRAEVERLTVALAEEKEEHRATFYDYCIARDEIAQLWKELVNEPMDSEQVQTARNMGQTLVRAMAAGASDLVLDPRLGLPQPDGEPCEPMSARKWRWLP